MRAYFEKQLNLFKNDHSSLDFEELLQLAINLQREKRLSEFYEFIPWKKDSWGKMCWGKFREHKVFDEMGKLGYLQRPTRKQINKIITECTKKVRKKGGLVRESTARIGRIIYLPPKIADDVRKAFRILETHDFEGLSEQEIDFLISKLRKKKPFVSNDNLITAEELSEITVKVAQIMRDYRLSVRFNEDLNSLQTHLERFLYDWMDIFIENTRGGNYDYWEPIHKRLNIDRPKRSV